MAIGAILGGAGAGAGISIVIKAIDQFSKPMKKMENGLKKQEKGFAKLTSFVKKHSVALMAVAGAMVGFAVSAVKSALKAEGAFQSFNLVVGETADVMLEDMRRASKGMISDFELVSNANSALALGIKQTDIPGLLEVATARSKVFGRTATEAFSDLAIGIGRQSRMILDNLGIILDLDKVYGEFAKTIGKVADELTDAEKKQAMVNAILEESEGMVKAQNFLLETHSEKISRVTADWKNWKQEIGETIIKLFDFMSGMRLAEETYKAQLDAMTGIEGTYEDVSRAIMDLDKAQKALTADFSASQRKVDELINSLLNLSDITFKGERAMSLQIAQQKEVIRQLELRELQEEGLGKKIEEENKILEKLRLEEKLAGEEGKEDFKEKIKLQEDVITNLKLQEIGEKNIGDELEKERDKLKELRLESDEYAIKREIQQAKNAMGLEKIGEVQAINFDEFIVQEQDKFIALEEERNKQEMIGKQLDDVKEKQSELMDVFDDAQVSKHLGYEQESQDIDDLINETSNLINKYKEAREASAYTYIQQKEDETKLEYAIRISKAIKESGGYAKELNEELLKFVALTAVEWTSPLKPLWELTKAFGGLLGIGKGKETTVEDAIIKPSGQIIKTHPQDTLIATRGGVGLTVIIEGNVYGTDPDEIAEALQDKILNKVSMG